MRRKHFLITSVLAVSLTVGLGLYFTYGFSGPSLPPPQGSGLIFATSSKVGIGTMTPGQKLTVAGVIESTSGGFKFPDTTTQTSAATAGVNYWALSGTSLYPTSTTYNVGIGNTNPTYTLDVSGNIRATSQVRAEIAAGTAPFVVNSTTLVANLNADLLDGLNSSAFGDATLANQTTILGRIGTAADAAAMNTTLFAGQEYLWENRALFGHQSALGSAFNGKTASCSGTNCDATATCNDGTVVVAAQGERQHGSGCGSITGMAYDQDLVQRPSCYGQTSCTQRNVIGGSPYGACISIVCAK